jgi:hypothetical protein
MQIKPYTTLPIILSGETCDEFVDLGKNGRENLTALPAAYFRGALIAS